MTSGGTESLLPPDAEELWVRVGHFTPHPIQFGLFPGAQLQLVVLIERRRLNRLAPRPSLESRELAPGVIQRSQAQAGVVKYIGVGTNRKQRADRRRVWARSARSRRLP